MQRPETTDWQQILGAANGDLAQREDFARRYEDMIRDRLRRLWANSPTNHPLDDAVQEVFVECFKAGGVLATADPSRLGGFRSFLLGVVDNVARRFDERAAKHSKRFPAAQVDAADLPVRGLTPSSQLDREWAIGVLREAAAAMAERAAGLGPSAQRRVELLQLRFQEGLPIRAIAARWQIDAAVVHHQYAKAREDFRLALLQVLGRGRKCSESELRQECDRLLQMLQE